MESILGSVYKQLYGADPNEEAEEWRVAEMVLDNFDVRILGEAVARKCILKIVNHVQFPDQATSLRVVGRAQGLATELWDDLPDEPHTADFEWKEFRESSEK